MYHCIIDIRCPTKKGRRPGGFASNCEKNDIKCYCVLSACLLSRSPGYGLHHMNHDEAVSAALQLQHDAGLMMTNLQILSQFVTSLKWMSSEVMRLAFGWEQYPADAMQAVSGMGLWRPTDDLDTPESLPVSSCNDCMMCQNCFPKLGP